MGGIQDGFGIPKWIREQLDDLDPESIQKFLDQFEKCLKISAQVIEALVPDTDWPDIVREVLELIDKAEAFEGKSGTEKRDWVRAELAPWLPVATRLLNNLIEDAVSLQVKPGEAKQ